MSDAAHPEEKKPNPGVVILIWLVSVGVGYFLFTLFFKMGMDNLSHGGTSWATAKDDLISAGVGIGVFSLIIRFTIGQWILDYYEKKAAPAHH